MESLPGAVSLFARAYQKQLGGNKTGQAAITELLDAMKKGKVKGDILTFAGDIASETAEPGLDAAGKASQAEQARYQNAVNDLAVIASQAGVEEGFARIFRTLNAGLKESGDLTRAFAETFNSLTMWFDDILLYPQSLKRAFEGRDSLVADWLGIKDTQQLKEDWHEIKKTWDSLAGAKTPEWMPNLESTTRELAMLLKSTASTIDYIKKAKEKSLSGEEDISFTEHPVDASVQMFGRLLRGVDEKVDDRRTRGKAVFEDENSPYYMQPERYDSDMALGINRYKNLSSMQFPTQSDIELFNKDVENNKIENNPLLSPNTSQYDDENSLKQWRIDVEAAQLADYPAMNPSGRQYDDQYSRDTWDRDVQKAMEEDSKIAAIQQSTVDNNTTNQNTFDIKIEIPLGLNGIGNIEEQAQQAAQRVADEFVRSLESVQTQFPDKE